jgi:hypothetical protein
VSENMVKPVAGAPDGDDSEARLRAEWSAPLMVDSFRRRF